MWGGACRQCCGILDGRVCIERGGFLIAGFTHVGGCLSPGLWASGRQGLH